MRGETGAGTIRSVLSSASERLAARGIGSARLDAELLLAHALGLDRAGLAARMDDPLGPAEAAGVEALLARREDRVPLAYITGVREFWSLEFEVDERVLIPRPETEHVVEHALRLLRGCRRSVVADVGTGAGPIAVALAREAPDAEIHAIDISTGALEVARRNAERHGVAERIRFHHGDVLGPVLEAGMAGAFDLVASNPPYVGRSESVQEEVLRWEPAEAVFAGDDGAEVIRRLVLQAAGALRPGGHLVMETALARLGGVRGLLAGAGGWEDVSDFPDLAGLPRIVTARRKESP